MWLGSMVCQARLSCYLYSAAMCAPNPKTIFIRSVLVRSWSSSTHICVRCDCSQHQSPCPQCPHDLGSGQSALGSHCAQGVFRLCHHNKRRRHRNAAAWWSISIDSTDRNESRSSVHAYPRIRCLQNHMGRPENHLFFVLVGHLDHLGRRYRLFLAGLRNGRRFARLSRRDVDEPQRLCLLNRPKKH